MTKDIDKEDKKPTALDITYVLLNDDEIVGYEDKNPTFECMSSKNYVLTVNHVIIPDTILLQNTVVKIADLHRLKEVKEKLVASACERDKKNNTDIMGECSTFKLIYRQWPDTEIITHAGLFGIEDGVGMHILKKGWTRQLRKI